MLYMEYQVFTSLWTAVSTLKSNYEVIFAIPNISSVQATEFHSKLPLHLKSLGFLQSTAIITLYSHCNLSEKKESTEQKKNCLKQDTAYKIYKVKGIYIYPDFSKIIHK